MDQRLRNQVLQRADHEAQRLDHEYLGTEHVLLALIGDESNPAARALVRLGIRADAIRAEISKCIPPVRSPVYLGRLPWTSRLRQALECAASEALRRGSRAVEPEDLLLGLLCEEDGLAAQILLNLGLQLRQVRAALLPASHPDHLLLLWNFLVPPNQRIQCTQQIDGLQDAPAPAVDMNLRVPNLARPITHPDILTRLWRSLVRLLGWKEDPPPERVEEQQSRPERWFPPQKPVEWTPLDLKRFTDRARKVMQLANQEAQRFNHEYIGTEHILLGLVKEGSGVAANVLKNLDIDLRKIRLEVEKIIESGPDMATMGKLPQTPRAKNVIGYSIEEARNLNHNHVGTEHLLLGLLCEHEGVAARVLMNLGLKLEDVREEVHRLLNRPD